MTDKSLAKSGPFQLFDGDRDSVRLRFGQRSFLFIPNKYLRAVADMLHDRADQLDL